MSHREQSHHAKHEPRIGKFFKGERVQVTTKNLVAQVEAVGKWLGVYPVTYIVRQGLQEFEVAECELTFLPIF